LLSLRFTLIVVFHRILHASRRLRTDGHVLMLLVSISPLYFHGACASSTLTLTTPLDARYLATADHCARRIAARHCFQRRQRDIAHAPIFLPPVPPATPRRASPRRIMRAVSPF